MSSFKKAMKTIVLFLVILTVITTCIMELFFSSECYFYQDYRERKELAGSLDYLIIGASHGLRAFRPDILDEELGVNSYNLAGSRMTMQGRNELLTLETSRNPVKTVVLEVSFDSMERDRDEEGPEGDVYLLGRFEGFVPRMKYFLSSFRLSEYPRAYYVYIARGVVVMKKLCSGNFTLYNTQTIKGYAPFVKENTKIPSKLKKIYNIESFEESIYPDNVRYLDQMTALCKEKGIRLIMVTTPLSRATVCRYDNLDTFREWYAAYAQEKGIEFYDFNLIKNRNKLFPDKEAFFDKYHLGNKGAETFTHFFADFMKKVDSGEDVSKLFYESYKAYDADQKYAQP